MSPAESSIRLSPDRHGTTRILRLEGELDLSTVPALRDALAEILNSPDAGTVELDCRDLVFVDSTGLGVLIAAQKRAGREKVAFRLICPSPNMMRLLDVTGLRDFFQISEE